MRTTTEQPADTAPSFVPLFVPDSERMPAGTTKAKPIYQLTLRAQHHFADPEGIRRLRSLLKVLKRSMGFDCLACIPMDKSETLTEGTIQ
jgi:hypothetical protein